MKYGDPQYCQILQSINKIRRTFEYHRLAEAEYTRFEQAHDKMWQDFDQLKLRSQHMDQLKTLYFVRRVEDAYCDLFINKEEE